MKTTNNETPIERAARLLKGKRCFMRLSSGVVKGQRADYVGRRGPDGFYEGTIVKAQLKGRHPNKRIAALRVKFTNGAEFTIKPDPLNQTRDLSGVVVRGDVIRLNKYVERIVWKQEVAA